ncbi:hypothetical protein HPB49_012299 [Dermacentor silvarum]|uniref:Uncharacterized protein n=1 Tax=Dermacentor silvarum TaxID=543639 RepID=A0ACB8CEW9_DERSI|nr:hypothetical protein HPB49_012299 [Dermacentor silvarum]
MACAPEKSELIRVHAKYARKEDWVPVTLTLHGVPIRELETLRILGMWIQENAGTHTVQKLKAVTGNSARMIRRVATSRDDPTEGETISLVHAFIYSGIKYAFPYQALTNQAI